MHLNVEKMIDQPMILSSVITTVSRIRKQSLSQSTKIFGVGSEPFFVFVFFSLLSANLLRNYETSFKREIRDHEATQKHNPIFRRKENSLISIATQMQNTNSTINFV